MKIVKSSNSKYKLKISKPEWIDLGNKNNWFKKEAFKLSAAETKDEIIKEAKWGKDIKVEQPGKWTNYSKAELISKRDAAKKRQEKRDKADPKDTELLRELNFAIRAKGDWGKAD